MKCFVTIGCKFGDLCSALPILYNEWKTTGEKPLAMVSEKYLSLFSGVSYVKTVTWQGDWFDLRGAVIEAKKLYEKVIVLSTFGQNWPLEKKTPSFQLDQWDRAGRLSDFGTEKLVFDQRSPYREQSLQAQHRLEAGAILCCLHSESSPFQGQSLQKALAEAFPKNQILDLAMVKAECIYDLLGLYDKAACLVSIETMHLHLSAASKVPVVALVTDRPEIWHGTAWQDRFALHVRYADYEMRKDEIVRAVRGAIEQKEKPHVEILTTDGYNPTMMDDFLIYRHHPTPGHWRTQLKIIDGVTDLADIKPPEQFKDHSIEDARFFTIGGRPHISYTVARTVQVGGANQFRCVMQYGEIVHQDGYWQIKNHFQPKYGHNDFSALEKNWSFWAYEGRLFAAYQRSPEQIIIEIEGDKVVQEYRTPCPPCSFGTPRGGTHPIRNNGEDWIQFFHTQTVNRKSAFWWNYSMGALTMDAKPPFAIKKISSHPVLVGNEKYFPNNKVWKPKVVIPFGAEYRNGEYRVSVGLNDSACAIATIKQDMLNL